MACWHQLPTTYPTADNSRYKFPDYCRVTFKLLDFKPSIYPIFEDRPDCNTSTGYPTTAKRRVNLKLPDFVIIKTADNPILTYKFADFPDKSRFKLPDYCRKKIQVTRLKVVIGKHTRPNASHFHVYGFLVHVRATFTATLWGSGILKQPFCGSFAIREREKLLEGQQRAEVYLDTQYNKWIVTVTASGGSRNRSRGC